MTPLIRTKLNARIQLISKNDEDIINWLFLPGGPGLGSESLATLTQCLHLPGAIWHLDLPGDGSNLTKDDETSFSKWSQALVEAVSVLEQVILVGHSTGGMYALATPELEKKLYGLVLMDSAPDAQWLKLFTSYTQNNPLPEVNHYTALYAKNPSNEALREVTLASAAYCFTAEYINTGIALLKDLPFNYKSCEWSGQHFDQTYEAKWYPKNIPALILTGEFDQIIPLKFFKESSDFQGQNILIREIKNAGHFPWVENPEGVASVFEEYYQFLKALKMQDYQNTPIID